MNRMISKPKRAILRVSAALASLGLTLASGACAGLNEQKTSQGAHSQQSGPIEVVASINQWGSLAQEIGGSAVHVTSIVNTTSVDAHDFEPKTTDIATIQKAQVVVTNGAGYDQWAQKSITKNATSISAAEAIGASTGDNPHLWFSKDARNAMATELKETFCRKMPDSSDAITARYNSWQKKENALEKSMKRFAKEHDDAPYAATESVAYYLLDDLGLKDKTPKGYARSAAAEGEPAPADLQAFKELISSRSVDLLINNTQEASDTTNILTGTAGRSEVPVVDVSEQMPEDVTTLTDWMQRLLEEVRKALGDFKASEATHRKVDTNQRQDNVDSGANGTTNPNAGDSHGTGDSNNGGAPSNEGQQNPGK